MKENPLKVLEIIKKFFNVISDKFAMNIRWRKLTITFCNKLFSRITYLQVVM